MQLRAFGSTVLGCLSLLTLAGCANGNAAGSILGEAKNKPTRSIVSAQFSNLPDLGTNGQYELWVERPGQGAISAGTFRINAQGRPTRIDGTPLKLTANGANFQPGGELNTANRAYVSLETFNDGDPQRNGPIILSGGIFADNGFLNINGEIQTQINGTANLSLDQAGAFFVLLTPTDNSLRTDNDNQGIHMVSAGLKEGLTSLFAPVPNAPNVELTQLPPSLVYEAWVVEDVNGVLSSSRGTDRSQARFRSVGRFTDVEGNTFDSDGLGVTAGPDPLGAGALGKGWVGSDFVVQGPAGQGENLANGNWFAMLSIEPANDPDLGKPFQILLYQRIGENAATGAGNSIPLANAYNVGDNTFTPASIAIKLLP